MPKIKRAIISVHDKKGVAEFAAKLQNLGVEIISTGGTAEHLNANTIKTISVSEITAFPEILDGRVKTLHPRIYGGILALRNNPAHVAELATHHLDLIDLVVVNLYPFEDTVAKPETTLADALENIDIGGPSMLRAAAKNYLHVSVVTSPHQYGTIIEEMRQNDGQVSIETNRELAADAFRRTTAYDDVIQNYLSGPNGEHLAKQLTLRLAKVQELRYGENPHQSAALYRDVSVRESGLVKAEQLGGKALSYNNFIDADAAMGIVQEFSEPCVAIIKHTNPCGVATGENLLQAYERAKSTDPVSAFGGIVGLNRKLDARTAAAIAEVFTEVVVAPGFSDEAKEILSAKKNLRLLQQPDIQRSRASALELKRIQGGLLVQEQDDHHIDDMKLVVVSKRQPSEEEWSALKFSWRVCKWVKSNAIVYALKDRTIGIGAGQMARVDSSRLAAQKALEQGLSLQGTVLASDAFFPFRDAVDVAAKAGATAIIQPGGSIRDNEVIEAADQQNMAMVFTGVRHFRH